MPKLSVDATLKLRRPMGLYELANLIRQSLPGQGHLVMQGQEIRVVCLADSVLTASAQEVGLDVVTIEAELVDGPHH